MKALREPKNLLFLIAGAGLAGMLLRTALYAVGADERGLIANYHPLQVACLLLCAAAAVYAAMILKKDDGSNTWQDNFPASHSALAFAILVPALFGANAYTLWQLADDRFEVGRAVMALLSVPCLLWSGVCRFRGKATAFWGHGIICLFFIMDLICRYRVWSGDPQMVDYVFQLLACVFLTLTAYYRTAFDVEFGSRRMFRFCSLMAVLFCAFSLAGPEDLLFYAGGFLWALSGILPHKAPQTEEG